MVSLVAVRGREIIKVQFTDDNDGAPHVFSWIKDFDTNIDWLKIEDTQNVA